MLEWVLALLVLVLAGISFFLYKRVEALSAFANDLQFAKQSQSVKYGKMSEHWIPLSEKFPYEKERFRFLGNPIDGLAFLDDKIVFCEFKANTSRLSSVQDNIKRLVQEKKVEWLEIQTKEGD
ncbi:MAG: Holliday junction resolvase-like protein [Candidatus Diapherotrites archaeon]|nr:Holliday junction resolvase-like protein [Candidatus Diapherotrites archaeon]MDZ4256672.1 Holliday junction resolvase-like protein [archaeon]